MGFKSRATSKSKRLVPLDIKCNHLGTTEYWCRGCAWIAADMLRREFEEQDSKIADILGLLDKYIKAEQPADPTLLTVIRNRVERLTRWP